MSALHAELLAEAVFSHFPLNGIVHGECVVCGHYDPGLVMLAARRGRNTRLASRVREHFRVELPTGPRRAGRGEIAFAGLGPGRWLVTHERGCKVLVDVLTPAVGDMASMVDQSDGLAVLRISGLGAREVLCKLFPVDLHERAFEVGAVACTSVAHMATILWRLSDCENGAPVFEIAVYRTFSEYFWRVLSASMG